MLGKHLFCNKTHSYKVVVSLFLPCYWLLVMQMRLELGQVVQVADWEEAIKNKWPNTQVWLTYGMSLNAINLPYCSIVDLIKTEISSQNPLIVKFSAVLCHFYIIDKG